MKNQNVTDQTLHRLGALLHSIFGDLPYDCGEDSTWEDVAYSHFAETEVHGQALIRGLEILRENGGICFHGSLSRLFAEDGWNDPIKESVGEAIERIAGIVQVLNEWLPAEVAVLSNEVLVTL